MDGIDAGLIQTLSAFDTLYLGFSGGLDSRVLLHILCQNESIRQKLTAIHVNHGLSTYANDWMKQTKAICQHYSINYQDFSVTIAQKNNIEESARKERYAIFEKLLLNDKTVLLLAHHQNDQAETLLLHLLRGAGIDGLAAMPEWRLLGQGQLYRPLLNTLRKTLEDYAKKHALTWIEDESNDSICFDRNFLRHQIMPLLQERWPGLVNNLSRSAAHCAVAKEQIDAIAEGILPSLFDKADSEEIRRGDRLVAHPERTDVIAIKSLMQHPRDMQKILLRVWIEKQGSKKPSQAQLERILDEVIPASIDANPLVSWKGGEVRRYQENLYFIGSKKLVDENFSMENPPLADTSCPLLQRGRHSERSSYVVEKDITPNDLSLFMKKHSEQDSLLCDKDITSNDLVFFKGKAKMNIRFRKGGEKIRLSGKTRDLKKLFQSWKIPPWERDKIPLIYINNVLVCICGWAVSDDYQNLINLNCV